jgi:hypothetical protein
MDQGAFVASRSPGNVNMRANRARCEFVSLICGVVLFACGESGAHAPVTGAEDRAASGGSGAVAVGGSTLVGRGESSDAGAGAGAQSAAGGGGGAATSGSGSSGTDTGASGAGSAPGGYAGNAGSTSMDPLAADVYLIAGQSNATGQGYTKNLPNGFVAPSDVELYTSGPPHLDSGAAAGSWIALRAASESPDRFGPELGFGVELRKRYPSRKLAIVKHAHSGSDLHSDWAPGASSSDRSGWGPQYIAFVATVTPALAALRARGLHPMVRAMLWQQGENDADSPGAANDYGKNLAAFIARVREQFDAPGMLFVYGYVLPPPNTGPGRDAVRNGQAAVDEASGGALSVKGAHVIVTDDLSQRADDPGTPYPNDHLHFGSQGQLELGRRMASKVYEKLGD